jgi:hypothetical protein
MPRLDHCSYSITIQAGQKNDGERNEQLGELKNHAMAIPVHIFFTKKIHLHFSFKHGKVQCTC